jgi:hypothetical protein
MQILALEIYTNGPDRLNGTLSKVLEILVKKNLHQKWLEQYTRCDEDPNIAALVELSHELRIDMGAFLYTPASATRSRSEISSPILIALPYSSSGLIFYSCTPVYDVALLARSLAENIQETYGHDDDDTSNRPDRKLEFASRTQLASEFVTKLRDGNHFDCCCYHSMSKQELFVLCCLANRSWMIADAQLVLLKSWKHFIQTSILRHPVALGFTLSSSLPWTYIQVLTSRLRKETRYGDGYLITLSSEEVSSLLFQLLSYFLNINEPSRMRILMSSIVEYEASENEDAKEWGIIRQAKGKGFEERVYSLVAYRATELLSTLSGVANRAIAAYLPATLSSSSLATSLTLVAPSSSSGLGAGPLRTMSVAGGRLGPLRSYSAASTVLEETLPSQTLTMSTASSTASSRLLSARATGPFGSDAVAASVANSRNSSGYAKAMQLVQNVLGSSLLLLKWSSTLLTAQKSPAVVAGLARNDLLPLMSQMCSN